MNADERRWAEPLAEVPSLTGNLFDDAELRTLWDAVQRTFGWQALADAFEYAMGLTRLAKFESDASTFDWNRVLREELRTELRRLTGM